MTNDFPIRRPLMRAVAFDEVGLALDRLIEIARSNTNQANRVADFLLAWWNGDDLGHFPVLHFCNCDAIIAEDILIIFAYLAQEPTTYANAWGAKYDAAMRDLVEQKRDIEFNSVLNNAHTTLAEGIDHQRFSPSGANAADQRAYNDRLASALFALARAIHPDRRNAEDDKQTILSATGRVRHAMAENVAARR